MCAKDKHTYGLDLVNSVEVDRVVEDGVEVVEEGDYLGGSRVGRYRSEAHDVREVHSRLLKLLWNDFDPCLETRGYTSRQELVIFFIIELS